MTHKSNDYKETAVNYYLVEDKTQEEVCKIFNCSRRSLMRWVEKYKTNGKIERNNRNPIAYKVKREHIKFKKFGCENPNQNIEIREKSKQTCLKNFGVENPFQNEEIKEKIKKTNLEKYGVEYSLQNEEIKEKRVATNLEKYGYENTSQNTEIQEKIKQTNLEKYGVEYPQQNKEVREKVKSTNLKKFGCECPLQNEEIKEKRKATNVERHGVEHPLQNPEILDKATKNSYRRKTFTFPSGNAISCQGYEPFALKELSQTHQELDIITGCKNVPKLSYKDETGKDHKHFVDIFIPSENKCIEVKSTWTAKKKQDCIFLKQESAKSAGYKYEIWIYNPKGEKVECHL